MKITETAHQAALKIVDRWGIRSFPSDPEADGRVIAITEISGIIQQVVNEEKVQMYYRTKVT